MPAPEWGGLLSGTYVCDEAQGRGARGWRAGEVVPATTGSGQAPGPGSAVGRSAPSGPDVRASGEIFALRNLVAVYRHLSGLAVQNASIATVTRLIAERTGATVAVVSPTMDILTAAAPGETGERAAQGVRDLVVHPRLGEVLAAASRARRALRLPGAGTAASVIVAPVLVGDDVPAHLLTVDTGGQGAGEDTSLLLTEHAATICGVILSRERVVATAASRVRDDLVEGLLSGRGQDVAETGRWARHLGYDPGRQHHVLSVALEAAGTVPGRWLDLLQRAAAAAESFLASRAPDAITSVRDTEVAVVLPEPAEASGAPGAVRLGTRCAARLGELFPEVSVTVGVGGPCYGPEQIRHSYAQARRTV